MKSRWEDNIEVDRQKKIRCEDMGSIIPVSDRMKWRKHKFYLSQKDGKIPDRKFEGQKLEKKKL